MGKKKAFEAPEVNPDVTQHVVFCSATWLALGRHLARPFKLALPLTFLLLLDVRMIPDIY